MVRRAAAAEGDHVAGRGRQLARRSRCHGRLQGQQHGSGDRRGASRILATRNPTASDLRVIVAIIKTITDLERIGDEGEKIGYIASRLAAMERPADKYREVKHLGRQVAEMVHAALDAFARLDSQAAIRTARRTR